MRASQLTIEQSFNSLQTGKHISTIIDLGGLSIVIETQFQFPSNGKTYIN